jgi:hypothetical protein
VNKDQVPEIAILTIKRDEKNSTEKKKDVRYRKVWKITERKEGQVNKEIGSRDCTFRHCSER